MSEPDVTQSKCPFCGEEPRGKFVIRLGGRAFCTKGEALRYTGSLLRSLPIGEVDLEHVQFLSALFLLHREWHSKRGPGRFTFWVRINDKYDRGHKDFWVRREDGSFANISFRECLAPTTNRQAAIRAFRQEIQSQAFHFLFNTLRDGMVCPVTGRPLEPGDVHVHHHPTRFDEILAGFVSERGIDLGKVQCRDSNGHAPTALIDRRLASEWKKYHDDRATYLLLSEEGHRLIHARAA